MKFSNSIYAALIAVASTMGGCAKFYDVNNDPTNIADAPIANLLPSITVNVGYIGGSDLFRYSNLIVQQFSGNTTNISQTFKDYERYNINNSDVNNQWSAIYATTLADIAQMIPKAEAQNSPYYAGVGRLLKAYMYQLTVDAWGDVPYSEAMQFSANLYPKYDDDADIYPDLIKTIDTAIANLNEPSSVFVPNQNTTIYAGAWTTMQKRWIRFGNTLKLRLYIHYTQKDPAFATSGITSLINSGAEFMSSNDDSFQMPFLAEASRQNPIASIEGGQFRNSFFPHRFIVNMMNANDDPRRANFFVPFPYNSSPSTYKGASVEDATSVAYSRLSSYLKGDATYNTISMNADGSISDGSITWAGNAPTRLLTFAEYNFIRAEAALTLGAPGDAQEFFEAGIRASMGEAGVSAAQEDDYVSRKGTLAGTQAQQLEQIINEKFIGNFGVVMENWTDWRRTGYPAITPLPISIAVYNEIPRTLVYPLSESSSNPNTPARTDMLSRVFWDTRN
ncbi:MAG: SusD/RagB family nutrient-binding outer membrane lipoprotein [Flavihumibacter sp.]